MRPKSKPSSRAAEARIPDISLRAVKLYASRAARSSCERRLLCFSDLDPNDLRDVVEQWGRLQH